MTYLRSRPNTLLAISLALFGIVIAKHNPVWLDTWVVMGVYGLIALSAGISYGQAGVLSMAQGAFAMIGGYAAAICGLHFALPPFADLALAVTTSAAIAYPLARVVSRLAPLATALATLALGAVIEIAVRNWESVTGGYIGLAGIPSAGPINSPMAYCLVVWTMICLSVLVYENLMRSSYGRALNVIRYDRFRAMADGVNVPHLLSATLALSAMVAASAGWLYAHYISFMSPQSLDTHVSISALLMAVIGGAKYILGPIVGTILFDNLVRFLPAQELQGLFYGAALILIVVLARDGLFGLGLRVGDAIALNRSRLGRSRATEVRS